MLASDERRALNKERAAAQTKALHGSGRSPLVAGDEKAGERMGKGDRSVLEVLWAAQWRAGRTGLRSEDRPGRRQPMEGTWSHVSGHRHPWNRYWLRRTDAEKHQYLRGGKQQRSPEGEEVVREVGENLGISRRWERSKVKN